MISFYGITVIFAGDKVVRSHPGTYGILNWNIEALRLVC